MEIQNSNLKYALFIFAILITSSILYLVKFPVTPSIDKSILFRDLSPSKVISASDYILFTHDHELIGGKKSVIKIVGCIEGDILERRDDAFYCNNILIKPIRLERVSGDPLPQFHFNGIVPKNKLFVYGTDQYSFGSRHWGFVDKKKASRLIPVI